jgi:hypothetical protein
VTTRSLCALGGLGAWVTRCVARWPRCVGNEVCGLAWPHSVHRACGQHTCHMLTPRVGNEVCGLAWSHSVHRACGQHTCHMLTPRTRRTHSRSIFIACVQVGVRMLVQGGREPKMLAVNRVGLLLSCSPLFHCPSLHAYESTSAARA